MRGRARRFVMCSVAPFVALAIGAQPRAVSPELVLDAAMRSVTALNGISRG